MASAADPPARFRDHSYWAKPVPGWGDASAKLWILGLAPAAHGGNRTGLTLQGDRSGDFLFDALIRHGLATDRQTPKHCFLSNAVRCAPPDNKPSRDEFDRCGIWLDEEWKRLRNARVVLAFGKLAWDAGLRLAQRHGGKFDRKPAFAHGAKFAMPVGRTLVASYHVSQQNTFTGRLTPTGLDDVLEECVRIARASR
ncbi:MAG: uracil-DNA glycosylase family protein [Planctomycetota bacterium]